MLLSFGAVSAFHFIVRNHVSECFVWGYRYIGGDCCQSIQHVYLKRHKHDEWSFVDYSEGYSCEFDWCDGSELMDRINEMHLEDPPSEHDLYNMGWRGPIEAEVFEFDDYYVGE